MPRREFGYEKTDRVHFKKPELEILEIRRHQYVCDHCEGRMQVAPMPPQVLPKFLLTPEALAWVVVMKYAHHLPVNRLVKMLDRHHILSVTTLQDEVVEASLLLRGIYDLIKKFVLQSVVLHVDDTPIRQLRGDSLNGYFWPYVGDANHPAVVFDFTPGRSGSFPIEFLKGYQGRFIQVDGFAGFNALFRHPISLTEVGCWCHARRKILEGLGPDVTKEQIDSHEGMSLINELFRIEAAIKRRLAKRPPHDEASRHKIIVRWRKRLALPILEKFQAWMNRQYLLPKNPMGKGIKYIRERWRALTIYIEHGCLDLENLEAERVIRPIALGRNNWNFVGSEAGGDAAAIYYSIIATCQRVGIDPHDYLSDVLGRIADMPAGRQEELLPWNWKPQPQTPPALINLAA